MSEIKDKIPLWVNMRTTHWREYLFLKGERVIVIPCKIGINSEEAHNAHHCPDLITYCTNVRGSRIEDMFVNIVPAIFGKIIITSLAYENVLGESPCNSHTGENLKYHIP